MTTKTKLKTTSFDPAKYLKTDEDLAGYLEVCMEDGDPALIIDALGIIARAKGMTQLSRDTGIAREALYRALSKKGNPAFSTVSKVFKALGYRLEARPV